MRHAAVLALLVVTATSSGRAQSAPANPMARSLQRSFASVASYIVRSAEQLPEDKYSYRATPDTRTFADEIAHVVDAHYMFCSRARNEANPIAQNLEGGTHTKAVLVSKLKESVAYCETAYGSATDATLAEPFQVGQARGVKVAPMANNIAHDNEHYGKIVTLLRLNGLVPPSSQPRGS